MKTQVNNLKVSSFLKILSLKSRQLVRNVVFYFSNDSWLRLQQQKKSANIKFERRDLTSAQKNHPSFDDLGETFAFNLIKQNGTHFSFIFLTQKFLQFLNLN